MKSLEVSEEKANQRVEEFKREMKTLTVRLKEAENRAESAEKQVKRLQKEVDRLEGNATYDFYNNNECLYTFVSCGHFVKEGIFLLSLGFCEFS